jgi:hypothetical protein
MLFIFIACVIQDEPVSTTDIVLDTIIHSIVYVELLKEYSCY